MSVARQLQGVRDAVEGFDYAFRHYSDFKEVVDETFHELRKAYVEAADALDEYLPEGE